jgi:carboxymethylenebutenolidase
MSTTAIKKEDLSQEVFILYDDYAHSRINRRDFMERLSVYAVGGLTVPALMSFLMPDYKNTLQVATDHLRIHQLRFAERRRNDQGVAIQTRGS